MIASIKEVYNDFFSMFLGCGDAQKDDDTFSPDSSNTSGNLSDLTQGLSKKSSLLGVLYF